MHIFIDESGSFIPPQVGQPKFAGVGALVVPSALLPDVLASYESFRERFVQGGDELKGSKLTEDQAKALISMLCEFDVVFDACLIDIGTHSTTELTAFREAQAAKLVEHLTPEQHPTLAQEIHRLRDVALHMPNQLFVQSFMTMDMLDRLLRTVTLYYAQRRPEELGEFHWRVDAKDSDRTPSEDWWTQLLLPMVQTRSRGDPLIMLEGADYSHFERYTMPLEAPDEGLGTDLYGVLRTDLQFPESGDDLGVQLIDNLVAILTRAFNGKLQRPGWNHLGRLMVQRREFAVRVVALDADASRQGPRTVASPLASVVVRVLQSQMKPMLTNGRAQSRA